jgi:hypothetical protein
MQDSASFQASRFGDGAFAQAVDPRPVTAPYFLVSSPPSQVIPSAVDPSLLSLPPTLGPSSSSASSTTLGHGVGKLASRRSDAC